MGRIRKMRVNKRASKATLKPKREILDLRKTAFTGVKRIHASREQPPDNTEANIYVTKTGLKFKGKNGKTKKAVYAEVTSNSPFHSPAYRIAHRIRAALNPDNQYKASRPAEVTGEGPPAVRTRGEILEENERNVRARLYGKPIWMKARWVEDLGDGTLRINIQAFVRIPYLRAIKRKHEERKKKLMEMRKGKDDGRST